MEVRSRPSTRLTINALEMMRAALPIRARLNIPVSWDDAAAGCGSGPTPVGNSTGLCCKEPGDTVDVGDTSVGGNGSTGDICVNGSGGAEGLPAIIEGGTPGPQPGEICCGPIDC